MKKKLIIATLILLFVFTFSKELSYSQPINIINIQQENNMVNLENELKQDAVEIGINKEIEQVNNDYMIMQATAYDLSIQSCGKSYSNPSRGITKDGYNLNNKSRKETMIVSSNRFPMGTKLKLIFPESHKRYNGIYTVHDTGKFRRNVLDIYLGDFGEKVSKEVNKFGRVNVKVWIVK